MHTAEPAEPSPLVVKSLATLTGSHPHSKAVDAVLVIEASVVDVTTVDEVVAGVVVVVEVVAGVVVVAEII